MTVCTTCGGPVVHETARSGAEVWWLDRCTSCGTTFNEAKDTALPPSVKVVN